MHVRSGRVLKAFQLGFVAGFIVQTIRNPFAALASCGCLGCLGLIVLGLVMAALSRLLAGIELLIVILLVVVALIVIRGRSG